MTAAVVRQLSATPQAAELLLTWPAERSLRSALCIGPTCRYADTLPAKIRFRAIPERNEARVTIPDPCYWTAKSPFLYRVRIEFAATDGAVEPVEIVLGLRRIHTQRGSFFLDGQRTVLRAIDWLGMNEPDWVELRESGTALILNYDQQQLFSAASRNGVPVICDVSNAAAHEYTAAMLRLEAALLAVILPRAMVSLSTAQEWYPVSIARRLPAATSEAPHFDEQIVLLTSDQSEPVRFLLKRSAADEWREQRRACDQLQAAVSAVCGDAAGYISISR